MTIEATPASTKFRFNSWANGNDGVCPCSPLNAKCEIPASYLNYSAGSFEKMEYASCVPVWASTAAPGAGTGGTPRPATPY
jgi:hypothetical protein